MRVVDLDRDMTDVIPTGTTRDSEFLFDRMTERTLRLAAGADPDAAAASGRRILDVASGFGQDAQALAAAGARVVGVEPSKRMMDFAQLRSGERVGPAPAWVRGWSDALPFATGSFDAAFCKGAIDHFDRPQRAIAEMARVTRDDGCVVLAIANFESLACRASRGLDDLRERWLRRPVKRGRRHYDVPSDHFTRYEVDLMREQMSRHVDLHTVEGVSLAWGLPGWSRTVQSLPAGVADRALAALDAFARRAPGLADVVILAGRPRHTARARTKRAERGRTGSRAQAAAPATATSA